MKRALVFIVLLTLTGCESLQTAGTSSLSIKPILVDSRPQGWQLDVRDGKQYASIDVSVFKTGDDYSLTLSARGVEAFRGQEVAAGATKSLASTTAKAAAAAAIAPLVLPAAGAALAAPGLGAAAMGAGALAVGQELAR